MTNFYSNRNLCSPEALVKRLSCFLLLLLPFIANAQITVAPLECYPQYGSTSAMDAAAASDGTTPFATWKGAYDYAVANGINTIDFVEGTYLPGGASGLSSDWGDAFGGFVIPAGMTVNGNGAVIDNSANANALAFATIGGNNAKVDGFTFVEFTGNNAGAMLVSSGLTGWEISNCNFDHCDWAGDGLVVNQGAGSTGTITGCNFYNHVQSTGSAMTVNGAGGDLDIINTKYTCNSRIVAGGAVRISGAASVNYDGCTFDGNLTNSASGGAISIEENSIVTFNNTVFTCNTATVNVQDDGGAMHIIEGSNVTITGCNFTGNEAQDKGGAIHVAGASASLVTLNISGTEFHNNEAQTATSYGGAMYIDDFNATISDNYFSGNQSIGGNTNGGGGGIYISAGNGTSSLAFNNNTFTGNTSGNGYSNAIRTEMDFEGTGNNIAGDIYTACVSPGPGFFNYAGDDFNGSLNALWTPSTGTTLSNSGGDYMFIDHSTQGSVYYDASATPMNSTCSYNTVLSSNTEAVTWTFTISNATGLDGFAPNVDGMAFVLGATDSDFFAATTNGYAVFFDRLNNTDIELTHFTGGLSAANATPFCSNTNGISSGNSSASVRVTYTPPSSWTLEYDWSNGSSGDLDVDPRGDNGSCMGPAEVTATGTDATYTGTNLNFTGFAMSGSNGTRIDFYHTRVGDGCTAEAGYSGSPAIATCNACLSTTNPTNDCSDQGSISGVTFDDDNTTVPDGINNGDPLAGVLVELYTCDGNSTGESVITGADGAFYFGGLENGACFYLQFTPPGGFNPTHQDASGSTTTNDSDADIITGQSPQIMINTVPNSVDEDDDIANETHYTTVDAGFTSNPLPVELIAFRGENIDCQTVLNWQTASETNNHYFEIQRSYDGRNFETLDLVYGAGTTATIQSYNYVDKQLSTATTYYRLNQVDYNNENAYSDIISISAKSCTTDLSISKISPNPFQEEVRLELFSTSASEDVLLVFHNVLGQQVKQVEVGRVERQLILNIPTEGLSPGSYFISILNGQGFNQVQKIIKR